MPTPQEKQQIVQRYLRGEISMSQYTALMREDESQRPQYTPEQLRRMQQEEERGIRPPTPTRTRVPTGAPTGTPYVRPLDEDLPLNYNPVRRPVMTPEQAALVAQAEGKVDTGQGSLNRVAPREYVRVTPEPVYKPRGTSGPEIDPVVDDGTTFTPGVQPDGSYIDETGKRWPSLAAYQQWLIDDAESKGREGGAGAGAGAGAGGGEPAPEGPTVDPFTGAVVDIPHYLRGLSDAYSGRQQLYNEALMTNAGYLNAPRAVQNYLQQRFNPLNAEYMAGTISALMAGEGGPTFNQFIDDTPNVMDRGGWQGTLGNLNTQFGGIGSAEDLAAKMAGMQEANRGAYESAYNVLRNSGRNILEQGLRASVHPAAMGAVSRSLAQRYADYSKASAGPRATRPTSSPSRCPSGRASGYDDRRRPHPSPAQDLRGASRPGSARTHSPHDR